MDTTSTALSATSTLANDTAAAAAFSVAAATNAAAYNAAAANNWVTVERELPSLTGPSASQPWHLAQSAAVQAASEAAAVPYFAGGPLGVPPGGGWSGASAVDRPASRGGAGRHPWEVDSSQLCRSDEVHEVTLPDYSAGTSRKSGGCGCGCGGSCGGKCGGSCGRKSSRDPDMDGGARPAGHGTGRASGNPYVLDDPRHNLVLLAQELLLLEGHLADPERRCPSCVGKHTLAARALADEGRRLGAGSGLSGLWAATAKIRVGAPAQLELVRTLRQAVVAAVLSGQTGAMCPDADGATGQTSRRSDRVKAPTPKMFSRVPDAPFFIPALGPNDLDHLEEGELFGLAPTNQFPFPCHKKKPPKPGHGALPGTCAQYCPCAPGECVDLQETYYTYACEGGTCSYQQGAHVACAREPGCSPLFWQQKECNCLSEMTTSKWYPLAAPFKKPMCPSAVIAAVKEGKFFADVDQPGYGYDCCDPCPGGLPLEDGTCAFQDKWQGCGMSPLWAKAAVGYRHALHNALWDGLGVAVDELPFYTPCQGPCGPEHTKCFCPFESGELNGGQVFQPKTPGQDCGLGCLPVCQKPDGP